MSKLDNTRQQSIKAWAPAQKKWQQDQQKYPNFIVEAENQNESDAAAAAAGAGFGGGGGYSNLPLTSLQTTAFAYTKVEYGTWYYKTMNHTTGVVSSETDSGASAEIYGSVYTTAGDAMGYSMFMYTTDTSRRIQLVSPSAEVITDYSWNLSAFPNYDLLRYYGGGIGIILYNTSTSNARLMYWYNGVMYQKQWTGSFYGFINSMNYTQSKNGVVNILLKNNNSNLNADLWQIGPGVTNGAAVKATYTESLYNITQDIAVNDDGYFINKQGIPVSIAGANNRTWITTQWDSDNYVQDISISIDSYTDTWSPLQSINNAISAIDENVNTGSLIVNSYTLARSGNDLVVLIADDVTSISYVCVLDLNNRVVRTAKLLSNITPGNFIITAKGSINNTVTVGYNQVGDIYGGWFIKNSASFLTSVLYKDGQFEQYNIPSMYQGGDVYLSTYGTIAESLTTVTFLASVDSLLYKVTITRGQPAVTFTQLSTSSLTPNYVFIQQCYNDIKGEWFNKITTYFTPHGNNLVEYTLINARTGALLDRTSIDLTGFLYDDHGAAYIPAMLYLQDGGVHKIWSVDYNTYKWNLEIDTTSTPTTDGFLYTYYEPYDAGYQNMPGGRIWIFADPDGGRCWYITTKHGVKQSNALPWAVIPDGGNDIIGQTYTYGVYDAGGEPGSCAIEVSTGNFTPVILAEGSCLFWTFSNDRWVYTSSLNNNYTLDVFIGNQKTSIEHYNIHWQYNDIFWQQND